MKILRFTLVAEGTSDRVLIPILRWMLLRHHPGFEWMGQIANLQDLPNPPRTLPQKIADAGSEFASDFFAGSNREAEFRRRHFA